MAGTDEFGPGFGGFFGGGGIQTPPGGFYGGGAIILPPLPPGSTVYAGETVVGQVPTPNEAGTDSDVEYEGPNPLQPTPPGQPGPPEQPPYAGPPVIFQPGPPPSEAETPTPVVLPPLPPPSEPPPARPPAPRAAPTGGPERLPGRPSGGWSVDSYEREVQRVLKDTAKRIGGAAQSAEAIIEGEILTGGMWGVVRAIGRVLGPISTVIGVLTPNPLGSGELTPEDRRRFPPPGPPSSPPLPPVNVPRIPLPPAPALPPVPSFPEPAAPSLPIPSPVAKRDTEERLPSTPSARTTAPRSPAAPPAPYSPPFALGFPLGALSRLTLPRLLTRTSPSVRPLPFATTAPLQPSAPTQTTPGIVGDQLTPIRIPGTVADPLTPSLTGLQPSALGFAPPAPPFTATRTKTKQCNCEKCEKPKKRKKPRKCRARAPVVWAGGPRKGKSAGSRCISFAK